MHAYICMYLYYIECDVLLITPLNIIGIKIMLEQNNGLGSLFFFQT